MSKNRNNIMNPIIDGIVSDITEDIDDLSIVEGDGLYNEGNTIRFDRDMPVAYMAKLTGGGEIEARTTLRSANLTRLVKAENNYRDTGRAGTYTQVSGDLRNVHLETEVLLGDEWISITEFLRVIYVALTKKNQVNSEADFGSRLRNLGFRFDGDATLLWHHFGADLNSWQNLDDLMTSHGAFDETQNFKNLTRITNITRFPAQHTGFEVTSIDVTAADRSQSQTQQGFINFVDAAVESMKRTLRYRALSKAEKAKAVGDQAAMYNQRAMHLTSQSTSWASNIAGIQERMTTDPTGQVIRLGAEGAPTDHQVDPAKAQIGRMTLAVNGNDIDVDLWTRSDTMPKPVNAVAAPAAVVVPNDISSITDEEEDDQEF